MGKPHDTSLVSALERIHSMHIDVNMRHYKLLGVYFDEYLSFDKQTQHICAKISRANFFIKRASNLLSKKSLRSLYFALIHPHLLYCINILSCTSNGNISRIATLQKKSIRIITKSSYNEHTALLFQNNKILPFDKIIYQARLQLMHSIVYNYAPSSFENIFQQNLTRGNDYSLRNSEDFTVPYARIELFKKTPIYILPKTWNECGNFRFYNNKTTFQIALKNHLLESITS
jgi:hypothetical protein